MIDFNGFRTEKILEEVEGSVVIFDVSKIIFYNSRAKVICSTTEWREIFFQDGLTSELEEFFSTGELEENKSIRLRHLCEGEEVFVEWKFRDISPDDSHRICLAMGNQTKILKEQKLLNA